MAWEGGEVRCWKTLCGGDHFFGLGEKGCPLDKRGTVLVNWNTDAAEHEPWSDPLYQTHPFLLVLNSGWAYGIFFDNTFRSSFDLGKTSRTAYSFGADGGEMNYYFIPGPTPSEVVQRYAMLIGTMPLPPLWTLGYQQCRFSYESARRVRQVAGEFRRRRIPCDTIYIDIDYMDGFRSFSWHPRRFARPERLMKDLAGAGFKCVVIADPGIKAQRGDRVYDGGVAGDHFCRGAGGKRYVGKVWPGKSVYPDFTRDATRRWWGGLHRDLLDVGVAGFWNDMNEPADFSQADGLVPLTLRHDGDGAPTDHREAHNIYGMQMARATFEGCRRLRPDHRPFVLTRAGYAGVQRYAAVWTGDNRSSWEHLRMSIQMLMNMGLSGIPLCGADIGGFRGHPSPELFTRWLQLGIFYPLCRVHTAGGPQQDPWSFGRKHERANRRAIELRYQLLPYLYTEFQHTCRTGLPLFRPLLLDFPDEPNVHRREHEFMFGRHLLVAPVVEPRAETRKLELPAGRWFDFADGTPRTGGQVLEIPVSLESIPVFARGGAVIPMCQTMQHVDDEPPKELILSIFPGNGGGWFYNDDGCSYAYRDGACTLEEYSVKMRRNGTTMRLVQRIGRNRFAPETYLLKFNGIPKAPAAVTADSVLLPRHITSQLPAKVASGWSFDRGAKVVWVRKQRLAPANTIKLQHKTTATT